MSDARDDADRYAAWKGWGQLFVCNADDAEYFAGETHRCAIAGADVLEIGFGAGAFLAYARARGAHVCGAEIDPKLQAAASAAGFPTLDADLSKCAGTTAFDTIVAFDVFEHLERDAALAALDACARLLRPGGHLLLRFPNAQSPLGLAAQHGDPTHRLALSKAWFSYHLGARPFEIVHYAGAYAIRGGGPARRLVRFLRRVARSMIALGVAAIYAQDVPFDPVVTLILRRREGNAAESFEP